MIEGTAIRGVRKRRVRFRPIAAIGFCCDDCPMSVPLARRSALASIRTMVKKYGSQIGVPDIALLGTPRGDGSPYVEVSDAYYFVVEERGVELERRKTDDLDELLYWIFDGVTFSISCDFELRNRKPGEDPRRQLFAKQEALLSQLSTRWSARKLDEHRAILTRHPFNDVFG